MENVSVPTAEFGQSPARGVMVWWERHGQRVFVFFVIVALVMVMPFLPRGPDSDWQDPRGQQSEPIVQTAVGGPSQVVHITVSATPNYQVTN